MEVAVAAVVAAVALAVLEVAVVVVVQADAVADPLAVLSEVVVVGALGVPVIEIEVIRVVPISLWVARCSVATAVDELIMGARITIMEAMGVGVAQPL